MRWPGSLRERARAALVVDRSRPDWGAGFRSAVIVAVPLVTAAAFDRLDIGLFATLGALNLALADPGGRYDLRMEATVAATALMTVALAVATLVVGLPVVAVVALGAWAFAMALAADLRPAGPGVSFVSLMIFIVALGLPDDPSQLGFRLVWFVAGCGWGIAVTTSLWPWRPDAPARAALAAALDELAAFVRSMPHGDEDREQRRDRVAGSIDAARTAILRRMRGRGHLAARDVAAVEIADDVQAGLGSLDRAIGSLASPPAALRAATDALAQSCDDLAECVRHDRAWAPDRIEDAIDELGGAHLAGDAALAGDVLRVMAIDLARPGLAGLGGADAGLADRGVRRKVSALLHPSSLVFRHAVRLAVVVGVAQIVAFLDPIGKSYWIPLTVAVVLKPTFPSTAERGLQRIIGTVVGVLIAFAITSLLGGWEWALIAAFVALTFALTSLLEVNYAFAVVGLTPAVIILLSIGGSTADLELDRLFGTLIGGVLALVGGYALWPSWARSDLGTAFGRGAALEARYLSVAVDPARPPDDVRAAHRDAERARSNSDATVRRMLGEPARHQVDPARAVSYCGRLDRLVETTTGLRLARRAAGTVTIDASRVEASLAVAERQLHGAADVLGVDDEPSEDTWPASPSYGSSEVVVLATRIRRDAERLRALADDLARELAAAPTSTG